VPVEHGLLIENLLDLAHAPFTHTSTFARGWPVSGGVRVWVNQPEYSIQEQCLEHMYVSKFACSIHVNTLCPLPSQIPDIVKFKAARMLSGRWDPYPISMTFEPPCMTISIIGLTQPGSIAAVSLCGRDLVEGDVCMPMGTVGGRGCVYADGHCWWKGMCVCRWALLVEGDVCMPMGTVGVCMCMYAPARTSIRQSSLPA
jgi:hypothetical protein